MIIEVALKNNKSVFININQITYFKKSENEDSEFETIIYVLGREQPIRSVDSCKSIKNTIDFLNKNK